MNRLVPRGWPLPRSVGAARPATLTRSCSRALKCRANLVFSAPGLWGHRVICCLAAGLSASAHPVQHEQNYTVVVFLKQANGVLPAAPFFGPSPARQGSAPPLRALDGLLPTQEPGLYRRGRPHGVRRPQGAKRVVLLFQVKRAGPSGYRPKLAPPAVAPTVRTRPDPPHIGESRQPELRMAAHACLSPGSAPPGIPTNCYP